jgi:uncharacterized protein YndB with AHSA1/START domain
MLPAQDGPHASPVAAGAEGRPDGTAGALVSGRSASTVRIAEPADQPATITAMSVRVAARVAVAAPPEAVFEAVSDWEAQSDWVALTTVTVEPGGHRVGERLTAVTKLAGLRFSDPMEVSRWEPPRRVDVRHLGRVVRGTGTFTVTPAPGWAWFTWAEDLDLPLGTLGRLGFALLRPAVELMLRRSLTRLARRIEGR